MPMIKLQQWYSLRNTKMMTMRSKKILLLTFLQFSDTQFKWSTVVKEGYAIYSAIKKWRHYLEDAEILLKSDANSLQKFLNGRTDNLKWDRWSLELQGRNIYMENIPGYKNKAADC